MHHNAWSHTPRVAQAYLEQESIDVMEWPARSPDLNLIEQLWHILQRRVSGRPKTTAIVQALTAARREEWNGINQVSVRRLIRSMPNPFPLSEGLGRGDYNLRWPKCDTHTYTFTKGVCVCNTPGGNTVCYTHLHLFKEVGVCIKPIYTHVHLFKEVCVCVCVCVF